MRSQWGLERLSNRRIMTLGEHHFELVRVLKSDRLSQIGAFATASAFLTCWLDHLLVKYQILKILPPFSQGTAIESVATFSVKSIDSFHLIHSVLLKSSLDKPPTRREIYSSSLLLPLYSSTDCLSNTYCC